METFKILVFNWRCWLNPVMGGFEVFTCEVAKQWAMSGMRLHYLQVRSRYTANLFA